METNRIAKITGFIIELAKYQIPVRYGEKSMKKRIKKDKNGILETEIIFQIDAREKNMQRAKGKIIDLINSNVYQWKDRNLKPYKPMFLTLTFKENITDLDFAHNEFTNFIKRLNYEARGWKIAFLKYLAVVEFQKRGAIHYHIIFFNLPYLDRIYDKLYNLWSWGSRNVKPIDSVHNVGKYMCKYLTKDVESDRLRGRKIYFTSRDLKKPIIIRDPDIVWCIIRRLPEETKTFEYDNESEYFGTITKSYYNLKNNLIISEQIQREVLDELL